MERQLQRRESLDPLSRVDSNDTRNYSRLLLTNLPGWAAAEMQVSLMLEGGVDGRGTGMMRRGFVAALAVCALLSSCASEAGDDGGANLTEVTAGLIVPATGPLAGVAEEMRTGVEIAVETWNELHESPQVTLEICDDGGLPERSLTCITRLESSVDFFIGPYPSNFWQATEQTYVDAGYFAIAGTPAADPPPDSNAFSAATPHPVALDMAFEFFRDQGWRSVGFVVAEDATGQAAAEAASAKGSELDLDVTTASFSPEARTAVPQLETIKAGDPDVVLIWTTGPTSVTALRAADQVGLSGAVPFIMNYANASPATYELAADEIPDDLRFIGSAAFVKGALEPEDPERADAVEAFRAEYHEQTNTDVAWHALAGMDMVNVAMAAVSQGAEPEEWASYLETGENIPGGTVTFSYSDETHVGNSDPSTLRLVKLVEGVWQFADER